MRHFKKSTKEEIEKMIELREQGHSCFRIGKIMGKHHTTIMWHIKKNNIIAKAKRKTTKRKEKKETAEKKPDHLYRDEKINRGKMSYKDYLEDYIKKEAKKKKMGLWQYKEYLKNINDNL